MANILIVEDNPQNLKLAQVILKQEGYEVESAVDAEEAEKMLTTLRPDLILMDLGLPGKDGYALARDIRRNARTTKIPILAVTSFAMRGDEERAREAGCSGYITKPINRIELLRQVRELLRLAIAI